MVWRSADQRLRLVVLGRIDPGTAAQSLPLGRGRSTGSSYQEEQLDGSWLDTVISV